MSNKFKSVWHVTVLFLSNTPIQTLSGSYGAEDDLTVVVVVTADDDEDGIGDDSELDDAAERSDFSLSTLPANVFNNYNSHPSIHPSTCYQQQFYIKRRHFDLKDEPATPRA